ncbi:MAG: hypothetical protein CXZ00_05705 [Acidobacteria bacterium]|nr:MAG: hypothetical protein CXZ00_05705 [Acidobacteriota bacterium]
MALGAPEFSNASDLRGVRALVLVGGRQDAERFGEIPLALLDVLGRSVLMRTVDRIRTAGIGEIVVLSDTDPLSSDPASDSCKSIVATPACFWEDALQQFRSLAEGAESVLVLRLGAWTEVNFAALMADHRRSGSVTMRAFSHSGKALDVFMISSSGHSEAAALLLGELRDKRIAVAEHRMNGYMNLLATPADLRTLSLDAFAGEADIHPCGNELRPGVWVGAKALIHRNAHIVAPAYIGAFCKVHSGAVVTRGSCLEHHSEIDCGTVIENSSVLPHTRLGAGLEVEYSVAGFHQITSLRANATVRIDDPLLIESTAARPSARRLFAAAWLLALLPDALWKWLFESGARQTDQPAPTPLASSTPPLGAPPLATAESRTDSYQGNVSTEELWKRVDL